MEWFVYVYFNGGMRVLTLTRSTHIKMMYPVTYRLLPCVIIIEIILEGSMLFWLMGNLTRVNYFVDYYD